MTLSGPCKAWASDQDRGGGMLWLLLPAPTPFGRIFCVRAQIRDLSMNCFMKPFASETAKKVRMKALS